MFKIDVTWMEVILPRNKFISPMGYELSEEIIKGYVNRIFKLEEDKETP